MSDPFDQLGRELEAAALRQLTPKRPSWRERWRLVVAALAGALGVSAVAVAATGILTSGSPVGYAHGRPPTADRHYGTTVPGSVRMLADDVPDPDGGLPWGLRTFATSRGYGCLQVGRVQDGRLGVLALTRKGGGLVEPGRFHELRPAVLTQATDCIPLDGAGHAFLAVHLALDARATPADCLYRNDRRRGGQAICHGELRTIDAGLLGPRARRVTYRSGGSVHTVPARGTAGGYLVVGRGYRQATRTVALGRRGVLHLPADTPFSTTPASATLTRIEYSRAPACVVHPTTSPRGACPDPPGFVPIPQPAPAKVATTVHAFAAPDRRGVRLRFRARAAVTSGRSAYNVLVYFPRKRCGVAHLSPARRRAFYAAHGGRLCSGGAIGESIDRDVAAGAEVKTTIDIPNVGLGHRPALFPGAYRVDVSYRVQPPHPRVTGSLASPGSHVGTAHFTVRRR